MTEVVLPEPPSGKYRWWDDYYDGLTIDTHPEERFRELGLYDEDQLREYARHAVLAERARCALACDDEVKRFTTDDAWGQGYVSGAEACAEAIRMG